MSTVIIKDVNGVDVNGMPVMGSTMNPQVVGTPVVTTASNSRGDSIVLALVMFFVSCWVVVEAGKFLVNVYPPGTNRSYFMAAIQFIFAWGYISFVSHLPPFYDRYYQLRTVKSWFSQFFARGLGALFLVYIMQAR